MARPKLYNSEQSLIVRSLLQIYEFLASLKLAVVLIFLLAVVLAVATVLESIWGTPAVQFYIYHTRFFAALLAMLAINIFCAASIRYPWKRYQTGFVVTHLGLLTLLGGSAYSFKASLNSQMLVFLDDASQMAIDQDYGYLVFENLPGHVGPLTVPFRPGPFNWGDEPPEFRYLNPPRPFVAYEGEGTRVEIVDFYSRSETRRLPFVDLKFANPGVGAEMPMKLKFIETSGSGKSFGFAREDFAGLGSVLFWQGGEREQIELIRSCVPIAAVEGDGVVVVVMNGEPIQVSVAELQSLQSKDEAYELDDGYGLKLVSYRSRRTVAPTEEIYDKYPWKFLDATNSGLISNGPEVTLKLVAPDGQETETFARFADDPFYMEGSVPASMRVEFFHPDVKGRVDLVEPSEGPLLCRVWQQKLARVVTVQDIEPGETIDTWSTGGGDRVWEMSLGRYQPRVDAELDRRTFDVVMLASDDSGDRSGGTTSREIKLDSWYGPLAMEFRKDDRGESKQVKVRVTSTAGGEEEIDEFWLRQTLPPPWMDASSAQVHKTDVSDEATVFSSYKVKETDVGFTLKLVDFDLDVDPGTTMAANYTSHLIRIDIRDEEEIRELREKMQAASGEDREELRVELKAKSDEEVNRYLRKIEGLSERDLEETIDENDALSSRVVTMNRPMDYPDWQGRNLRFFQENYLPPDSLANRSNLGSIFRVNFDPGRFYKYLGSLLIVLGAFIMFYMRAYFFKGSKKARQRVSGPLTGTGTDNQTREMSAKTEPAVSG